MTVPPKKILAPVDFTAGSRVAVDYALFLASTLGGSVTLLHVLDRANGMSQIVPGADNVADRLATHDATLVRLNELRMLLGRDYAYIDATVESGDATDVIIEHARAGGFDLIVMGTHGRVGIDRVLMGSVAEGVVRRASIPVVTVHLPRHSSDHDAP